MEWSNRYFIWYICIFYCVTVQGEYIGCYEETSDLYESVSEVQSIDACRSNCSSRDKTYYVVKSGKGANMEMECHCADRLPNESTDSKGCDRTCEPSVACGGKRSRSIYSVCARGYWGWSCDSRCCCEEEDICQKSTGLCMSSDGQVPGSYELSDCVTISHTEEPTTVPNKGTSNTTIIVLAVVIVVLVIIAAVVTAVVLIRKRRSKTSQPDDPSFTSSKPNTSNIRNDMYDTVGEEKDEGFYHTIPDVSETHADSDGKRPTSDVILMENTNYEFRTDSDDKRPTSEVIILENTNYESQETHAEPDEKRPTSDVIKLDNNNYESQETHADLDDKRHTPEDIILDNTNYESQDLANNTQQRENEITENDKNNSPKNMFDDSGTVVVNEEQYNLQNQNQNKDLSDDGILSSSDSVNKGINKGVYNLQLTADATDCGKNKSACSEETIVYSLEKNPEDTGLSEGAYNLAKNPEEPGVSGGVYNLAKNPDNDDVNEDTNVRMNESEKIVNGDLQITQQTNGE